MTKRVYGAFHKNDEIRLKSSSGGVFIGLANTVIDSQGIVFGAKLSKKNGNFVCNHIRCNRKEELSVLQGSKYIPSKLGTTYADIKKHLENGKKVLFSGTPCQAAGLLSYLGKSYENLYVIDFICHGVPTPLLLKKVIEEEKIVRNSKKFILETKQWGGKSTLFF